MNVLLVTGIFPPDHGGPASYVPEIAKGLIGVGHKIVAVICLSDAAASDDTTYPFPVVRIRRGQNYLVRWLKTVLLIKRFAKAADVVYLNGLVLEGVVAAKILARRRVAVKVVGDLIWEKARNQGATTLDLDAFQEAELPWRWRLLRRLQDWYTGCADIVITPSQYLARIVRGWSVPGERVRVVYNAVAVPRVPEEGAPVPEYDLVTVCRLVPWKGVEDLIAIAGKWGWSLRIVGDGPLRGQLEERARQLGARVSFAGHVPKERVRDEIRSGRLFVLFSSYEGLPHIILEAKAAGVAVVASAAGGTSETIEHGVDGWLVQPGAVGELAEIIERLLSDHGLRRNLAAAGYHSVNTRFGFQQMVLETDGILRGIAA